MRHETPAASDDSLVFAQETVETEAPGQTAWTVLVVDDEPDVYTATCMAMRGVEILGRPVHLFLTVKVDPRWQESRALYAQFGLDYDV